MKIVCISRYFFPSISGKTQKIGHGAEVRIYELYRRLAKMGHEVHLVVPSLAATTKVSLKALTYTEEVFEGMHIHRTPSIPPFATTRLFSIPKVLRATELKGDILVAEFHPFHAAGYEALLTRLFSQCPLVLDVHDVAMSLAGFLQSLDRTNENICYNASNGAIVCSNEMEKYVKSRADKKTCVIPNGVNTDWMKPKAAEEIRRKYGLGGYQIVGFSGSLTQQHGVEYLIRAAPYVLEKEKNAKFFVVGGGSEEKRLKELAARLNVSEKFIFTGLVPYEKMPEYLSAMDLCVAPFPSGIEFTVNFPLKLSEYLSAARAIVTTDGNVLVRVLKESGGGITAKSENPKDIADKIVSVLKDDAFRKRLGKKGREYAIKKLDWGVLSKEMSGFLKEF